MNVQPKTISISTGTILRVIMVFLILGLAWLIRDILLYVFTAFLLAGVLYPFAVWAERHKIPRSLSVLIVYVLLIGIVVLLITMLTPALVEESRAITERYGQPSVWIAESVDTLKTFTDKYGLTLNVKSGLLGTPSQIPSIFSNIYAALGNAFDAIAGIVIVFVLSFYIIIEDSAIKRLFQDVVPRQYQEWATNLIWQMMHKLGAWMRGQMALCLIIGTLYLIVFVSVGVPYPVLLAVLGGLLEFVPYLGPFFAAIPAVLLALTVSPGHALITLGLIVLIQQLENHLIVPKLMQKAVGLNPIISIIAFLIGAKLFGVLGALFAIPLATTLSLGWNGILQFQRKSVCDRP